MAKWKWYQIVLPILRLFAKKVADGDIGAGKKTSNAGKVAGDILDGAGRIIKDDSES